MDDSPINSSGNISFLYEESDEKSSTLSALTASPRFTNLSVAILDKGSSLPIRFAERVNTSPETRRHENGMVIPRPITIFRLCRVVLSMTLVVVLSLSSSLIEALFSSQSDSSVVSDGPISSSSTSDGKIPTSSTVVSSSSVVFFSSGMSILADDTNKAVVVVGVDGG